MTPGLTVTYCTSIILNAHYPCSVYLCIYNFQLSLLLQTAPDDGVSIATERRHDILILQ